MSEVIDGDDSRSETSRPFLIRAHHTRVLHSVLRGTSVDDQIELTYLSANQRKRFPNSKHVTHSYFTDVYGENNASHKQVKSAESNFYSEFLELEPGEQVKLVIGQKDGICDSCAIGAHCELPSARPRLFRGGDDLSMLRAFTRTARTLKLSDELAQTTDVLSYANGSTQEVPAIVTNAQAARDIIGNRHFLSRQGDPLTRGFLFMAVELDELIP